MAPDYSGTIDSNNDNAEEGAPQSNPESGGQIIETVRVTKVHQDFLKDENRTCAAKDSEGLAGKQTEDTTSKKMTKEGLQHTLETVGDVTKEATKGDGLSDSCQVNVDNGS